MSVDPDGIIQVVATGSDVIVTEGGGGGSGPKCVWRHLSTGEYENLLSTNSRVALDDVPDIVELPVGREPTPEEVEAHEESIRIRAQVERSNADRLRAENARRATPSLVRYTNKGVNALYRVFSARCPTRAYPLLYIPPGVSGDESLATVIDRVRARVPDVQPDVNPSLEVGGFVNLGMWLAVAPAADVAPITAEAGPDAWATASATHRSTTFEFGNGDSIECDGIGDPIVDTGVVEQSPTCGYTYRAASPASSPYTLTITMNWDIPYSSSGGDGVITFARSVSSPYDIDEIQTLGTG